MNEVQKIESIYIDIMEQYKDLLTYLRQLIERPGNTHLLGGMHIPMDSDEVNLLYKKIGNVKELISNFEDHICNSKDKWKIEATNIKHIISIIDRLELKTKVEG